MIQRIQTLFLLLSAIVTGAFFIRFANFDFLIFAIFNVLIAIVTIVPVITIFLFKNRSLQIKLCYSIIFINILLLLGLSFYLLSSSGGFKLENGVNFVPFILSTIFLFLAIRYIKRDEKIVKSVDKIR